MATANSGNRSRSSGPVAVTIDQIGKVLDVADCATGTGVAAWALPWGNAGCQKWTFTHVGGDCHPLGPTSAIGTRPAATGCSAAVGDHGDQGFPAGTDAQWRVEPLVDGGVRFVTTTSGRSLELVDGGLVDGGRANGNSIIQWAWLDDICQRLHLRTV